MGRFEQLNIIVTIGYINLSLHPGYSYQKLYKTIVTKGYINLSKKNCIIITMGYKKNS